MRCAVLDDYQEVALAMADWSLLRDKVEVTVFRQHFDCEDALVEGLRDFEIIVLMRERTPFGRALFARLPKLRLLVTTGESNPSIDIRAAAEAGVVACGTPYLNHPTAELTWGLIISLLRHIPLEDNNIRRNARWQSTVGVDLAGRVLGILGLGQLGTRVARIGAAFGMKVIAWSNNLTQQKCQDVGVDYVSKSDLLSLSDVLTIHTNLSARTLGLIAYEDLAQMKRSAYLVNTSRAAIVEEGGLIRALDEGLIAGAALDVFYQEPLPLDDPIRKMPRTVLTPHLGYVTEDNYRVYYRSVVENIRSWLDGKAIRELHSLRQVDRSL
jgi:phosphoglycerate dehydrogenase-like enzyme